MQVADRILVVLGVAGVSVDGAATLRRHQHEVPGFVQQRMQRRVGAGIHAAADDPGLALTPVAAGNRRAGIDLEQFEAEAAQQGRGRGPADVGDGHHLARHGAVAHGGNSVAAFVRQ